jgi:hypothetical protein
MKKMKKKLLSLPLRLTHAAEQARKIQPGPWMVISSVKGSILARPDDAAPSPAAG